MENDFDFLEPILEEATEESAIPDSVLPPEDRSLGEIDVPLSFGWIRR